MIFTNTFSFLSVAFLATQVSAHAYISKVRQRQPLYLLCLIRI